MEHPRNHLGHQDLIHQFQSRTLPKMKWTHDAHFVVGLWYVLHFGAETALKKMRDDIRAYNKAVGTQNSETSGYHETVTRAYIHLLDQFLLTQNRDQPFSQLWQKLQKSGITTPRYLERFYSKDILYSRTARLNWVKPDLSHLSAND